MVYLITYDLNKPGKDYTTLWAALRRYDYIRDTNLDSVWFVSVATWSASDVYNNLAPYLDQTDRIFVTQIKKGEHQGWMDKNIWAWINART